MLAWFSPVFLPGVHQTLSVKEPGHVFSGLMFHPSPSVGSLVIAVAFRPLELWFITPCARLCYLKYGPGSGIDFTWGLFFFFFRNTGPQASPDLLNQSLHFNKSSGDFCARLRVTALGWAFYEDGGEHT